MSERTVVTVPLAALLLNPTAWAMAAELEYPPYGKYLCISDRVVGMQGPEKPNEERFAGRIKPSPDIERFFITIRKIEKSDFDIYRTDPNTKEMWSTHSSRNCFSEQQLKDLQDDWDKGYSIPQNSYGDEFQKYCLMVTELHLDTGDGQPSPYYSMGRNVFRSENNSQFWISSHNSFLWDHYVGGLTTVLNFYHHEGRCSLVTPQ
jgi:hypothetical protein